MPCVTQGEVGLKINMYQVYLLKLANNTYYSGYSDNVGTRIMEHTTGKCDATKKYRPVKLVWYCSFKDKYRALKFEKYLKTASGKAFRNKRLI